MGVIDSGHNSGSGFTTNEQVTASTLNAHVNDSTFDSSAVDNDTIEIYNSSGTIRLKDSSSKTTGVTFAKMQHIDTLKVLGRLTAGEGDVETLDLDTDLSSVSSNDDSVPSAKATKTYVDTQALGVDQKWAAVSRSFNTSYTNNTGNPIVVGGHFFGSADGHEVYINFTYSDSTTATILFVRSTNSNGGVASAGNIIVPTGASYNFTTSGGGTITSFQFYELS